MSMNLNCVNKETKKKVSLWQTPTKISYLIYADGQGGNKAILERYEKWVWSGLDEKGVKDHEKKSMKKDIELHLNLIREQIKNINNCEFWVN